jgi:predicted AlkP superfamily pyrophosphatase or phosphodiesterase
MIYDFVGSRRCREMLSPVLKSIKNRDFYDLYVIHLGELDGLGHKYGPHPELFRDHLLEMDFWLSKLFQSVRTKGLDCNLIITSDHGMADVKGMLDIEARLKESSLRIPQDYVYFLDSTMARFWFYNNKARGVIAQRLSRIPHGHILSECEKERLHINMEHNAYGELIFWVDKGFLIFPNFFQSITSKKTKGMHGYMDDRDGVLIVYSDEMSVKSIVGRDVVPLTEVFNITKTLAKL